MAPPAKAAVKPPDTLPAGFFDDHQPANGSAPSTLPPDFFDKEDSTSQQQPSLIQRGQNYFDKLSEVQPHHMPTSLKDLGGEALKGIGNIGGAGIGLLTPLVHPIDTAKSIIGTEANPFGGLKEAKDLVSHPLETAETLVGQGGAAELAGAGLKPIAGRTGEFLKNKGAQNIDRTAGSLQADFKHGAEPGRGYLEGGGTPAISMKSLSKKAGVVAQNAGQGLQKAYTAADATGTKIPAESVLKTSLEPIDELRSQAEGFGGSGIPSTVAEYEKRLYPPIAAAEARGGYTPTELWNDRKNMAANTRWNDPTMFDLNSVRQQTVGGIGGLLTDAVPESKKLNRIYQGSSNLSARAGLRAQTGSTPLSTLGRKGAEMLIGNSAAGPLGAVAPLVIDSPLVKTGAGYGMFKAGQSLPAVAAGAPPVLAGAGTLRRINKKQPDEEPDEK